MEYIAYLNDYLLVAKGHESIIYVNIFLFVAFGFGLGRAF